MINNIKNSRIYINTNDIQIDPGKICFAATAKQYYDRYGNDLHTPNNPSLYQMSEQPQPRVVSSQPHIIK